LHHVSAAAVNERMTALRGLIEQKNLAFRSTFVGKQLSAVTLVSPKGKYASEMRPLTPAMTDNFISVEITGNLPPNLLISAQIADLTAHGVSAAIIAEIHAIA
jgi:hypothetical protein